MYVRITQGERGLSNAQEREVLLTLVKEAQSGSQDAFEMLKNSYRPLIESSVRRHRLDGMSLQDVADMEQEAVAIFCSAVCSYDCCIDGVELGLYAKICIDNGLTSFVRAYLKRSRAQTVPLDDGRASCVSDPISGVIERESAERLIRTIKDNLSEYENRVWWLYASGMSASDIASAIGADVRSVSNAIYRIRRKLRERISYRG